MSPKARADLLPKKLHGKGVRCYVEGDRVLVAWRERRGAPRQYRGFPKSKAGREEARSFAEGTIGRLTAPPANLPNITLREMWNRFAEANAQTVRPRTLQLYAERWRRWEHMWTAEFLANRTTLSMLDEFRAIRSQFNAPNQVGAMIRVVKIVYGWADTRELLSRNVTGKYRFRFGKDEAKHEPGEFRTEQWEAILRALSGQTFYSWRPWAVTMLAGSLGARIRAVLRLRWEDVDLDGLTVRWSAENDKTGQTRVQPLTFDARSALLTAAEHRAGPWVFHAARDPEKPVSYQSWHSAFRTAEVRAGVPHDRFRAAHGLRRMAAGEVWEKTGDAHLALQWIGDRDPRRAREYLKRRDDKMEALADLLNKHGGKDE